MTKSIFVSLIAIAVMITVSSCKKKKTEEKSKTRTENITASSWKMTAFVSSPGFDYDRNGNASTDVYGQMDPCEKDNLTKFNGDYKATEDEGATKCDPTDPQATVVNWNFSLDETKLTWDGTEYTINRLDGSTMILKSSFVAGTQLYEFTATFSH